MSRAVSFACARSATRAFAWVLACAFACAAALNAAFAVPAWAYVDPSVMTYTIQALAGVAVALSAVAGVAFRRGRRLLFKMFGIDEDARKQHEPAVHRMVGGMAEGVAEDVATAHPAAASGRAGVSASAPKRLGAIAAWRIRLVLAAAVCLFASLTVLVASPLEIVAGSVGSLVYGLFDVAPLMIGAGFAVAVVAALLLSLLRGRAFGVAVALVFALGLAAYMQALFMNGGLPAADGSRPTWSLYMAQIAVSAVVWAVVVVGCAVAGFLRADRAPVMAALVSAALFIVQGVGLISLFVSPQDAVVVSDDGVHAQTQGQDAAALTEDGLFQVSAHDNIVVFVLDFFDTRHLQSLVADNPGMLDELTGFTWFENASGGMIPTRYAIPYLLTGEMPHEDEKFSTYLEQRYSRSSFLSDMHDLGYSVGIYTDSLNLEYLDSAEAAAVAATTVNLHQVSSSSMDRVGTWKALMRCSLYRDAPWLFKRFFWFYTDEVNTAMVAYDLHGDPAQTTYLIKDAQYFERLGLLGLTVEPDERGPSGAFRFIHLLGAHYPYTMNATGQDVGLDNSSKDEQALGSFYIVSDYLHRLKDAGLYDSATVIVTSDHGTWWLTPDPLDRTSEPILLVKPAQDSIGASQPLVRSAAPVSHADLIPTIVDAAGGNASAYAFGKPVFAVDEADQDRLRTYLTTTSDGRHDVDIVEYELSGDVLDLENWHLTGRTWAAQE